MHQIIEKKIRDRKSENFRIKSIVNWLIRRFLKLKRKREEFGKLSFLF